MFGAFFGQFLLSRRVVSPQQLDSVLESQGRKNAPLGALAMERGHLDAEQVERIRRLQLEKDVKFGAAAVELGMLSPETLKELLQTQTEKHLYLGEALVREGHLEYDQLQRLLDEFHLENREMESSIRRQMAEADPSGLLATVAETVQRIFARAVCGSVKVRAVDETCALMDDSGTMVGVLGSSCSPQRPFDYGFACKRWYLYALIYCLLERQTTNDALIRETLTEFSRAIDYALAGELKGGGRDVAPEAGGVMDSPALQSEPVCLEMDSTIGSFTLFFALRQEAGE